MTANPTARHRGDVIVMANAIGTAAFTAFIARETSRTFAATQFALFTALAALPRSLVNATTGFIVEYLGYVNFFLFCAAAAIPGMLLLFWVAPWGPDPQPNEKSVDGNEVEAG